MAAPLSPATPAASVIASPPAPAPAPAPSAAPARHHRRPARHHRPHRRQPGAGNPDASVIEPRRPQPDRESPHRARGRHRPPLPAGCREEPPEHREDRHRHRRAGSGEGRPAGWTHRHHPQRGGARQRGRREGNAGNRRPPERPGWRPGAGTPPAAGTPGAPGTLAGGIGTPPAAEAGGIGPPATGDRGVRMEAADGGMPCDRSGGLVATPWRMLRHGIPPGVTDGSAGGKGVEQRRCPEETHRGDYRARRHTSGGP